MMFRDMDTSGVPLYEQRQQDRQDRIDAATQAGATGPTEPSAPAAPAAPSTPVSTPGPAQNPQGQQQGAPAPTNRPTPPAVASAVEGLVGSEATGGLRGTFQQAGTRGFAQKFGGENPAVWFRKFAQEGKAPAGMNKQLLSDRGATTRGGASAGGAIPQVSSIADGSGVIGAQNGGNDEEWQRFMRAVNAQRFGGA